MERNGPFRNRQGRSNIAQSAGAGLTEQFGSTLHVNLNATPVRRPQRDRQPQTSPAVGRDLHRPGVRLQQRIVYEPHSGVHADNQRKQHRSEKAIRGAGRNGVLPRNIELTLFRAQQIQ